MQIFDGKDLISVKIQQHPFAIIIYNDMASELKNISVQFMDLPADIIMISLSKSEILTDLTATLYYVPISPHQKNVRAKILITFTSKSEFHLFLNEIQIITIMNEQITDYFNTISGKIGYVREKIPMNVMQFSLIPTEPIQNLKCWSDLYIVFDSGSQEAIVYGRQKIVERLVTFLLNDFTSNIEKYSAYFALGKELSVSLDYLVMMNYVELRSALMRVNTLLNKLSIEFQFDTAENKIKSIEAAELEYLQNQILSAHI